MSDGTDRGILVLAFGPDRYRDQAVTLARSLARHGAALPRAVVTDHPEDGRLADAYDVIVPFREEWGRDQRQKLYLDRYTPFSRTLFVDADCLALRDPTELFDAFAPYPFGVVGGPVTSGDWYGDVAGVLAAVGAETMPKFNGGVYYLGEGAAAIAEAARELIGRYDELGLRRFRGGAIGEEPLYAVAMAQQDVAALDDRGRLMQSLVGNQGRVAIDALSGRARFRKWDRVVEPAVIHFVGDHGNVDKRNGAYYARERWKLAQAEGGHRSDGLIRALAAVRFLPRTASYVVRRRLVWRRRVARREASSEV